MRSARFFGGHLAARSLTTDDCGMYRPYRVLPAITSSRRTFARHRGPPPAVTPEETQWARQMAQPAVWSRRKNLPECRGGASQGADRRPRRTSPIPALDGRRGGVGHQRRRGRGKRSGPPYQDGDGADSPRRGELLSMGDGRPPPRRRAKPLPKNIAGDVYDAARHGCWRYVSAAPRHRARDVRRDGARTRRLGGAGPADAAARRPRHAPAMAQITVAGQDLTRFELAESSPEWPSRVHGLRKRHRPGAAQPHDIPCRDGKTVAVRYWSDGLDIHEYLPQWPRPKQVPVRERLARV